MSENEILETKVRELLAPKVSELELFLEKIVIKGSKNTRIVEVYLDLPAGTEELDSERLEHASREISAVLDANDPIAGAYNLEVSTLGAEHTLDNPRLFARAIGKDVEIKRGGKITQGVIKAADENGFTWETNEKQETVLYVELESAKTVILFQSSKAAAGKTRNSK